MDKEIRVCLIGCNFSELELRMLALLERDRSIIISQFGVPSKLLGKRPDMMIMDDLSSLMAPEPIKLRAGHMCTGSIETNFTPERPYGWYRQFEKKNGKRNKKL